MRGKHLHTSLAAVAALLMVVAFCIPSGAAETAEDAGLLAVGAAAPAFEAASVDGKVFNMEKELAGRPVLLVFWSIF